MTLKEALEKCGNKWIRPFGWDNYGSAFESKQNMIIYHCYDGSSQNYIIPIVSWITGEWEIVTPEQVMAERK